MTDAGGTGEDAPAVAPPPGTVEAWALDYISTEDLAEKLSPPPSARATEAAPPPRRITRPGRPPSLRGSARAPKSPGREALRAPLRRAQLVHTFLHHELQAAELMAWAVLAFPEAPRAFRRGLLGILADEVRHMNAYQGYLASLGHTFGDFPVRDWFWERVPSSPTPAHFVAVLGIGFEGGNLDHAPRFAERFRAVGDLEGAALQERICAEEVPHVRFALRWFAELTAGADFATWMRHLPPPLSPMVMRGAPINVEGRRRAGFSDAFLEELVRWTAAARGC
jgi:uncharacterized ferritin-like protein (DUF455 family)